MLGEATMLRYDAFVLSLLVDWLVFSVTGALGL